MNDKYDDNDLRAALGRHADQAPPDGGLLTAVHERSRELGRRRFAVTGGVAAIALAATVLAVQNLAPGAGGAPGSDSAASPSPSSSGWTEPKPNPPEKNPLLKYTFPYKATWKPQGFDNAYGMVVNEGLQRMGYLEEPALDDEKGPVLVLDLYDERPDTWPSGGEDVDVRGTTGILRTAAGEDVLAWEEDGRFFMLRTQDLDESATLDYAEGLEKSEGPGYLGSRCGYATRVFEPGEMVSAHSLYKEPDKYYRWTTVEAADYKVDPGDTPPVTVDIGDRDAVIATDEKTGERVLTFPLNPAQIVAVHADPDYSITDEQLVYDGIGFLLSMYPC